MEGIDRKSVSVWGIFTVLGFWKEFHLILSKIWIRTYLCEIEELGSFKDLGNLIYDDKSKTTAVLARMVWNWFKSNIFTKVFVSFIYVTF